MKRYLILLYAFIFSFLFPQAIMARNDIDGQLIDAFIRRTQSGNVTGIFSMLTDPIRSRMKTLLQENKEYKKTLQKRYFKAKYSFDRLYTINNDTKVAEVTIFYMDGSKTIHKFLLKRVGTRNWKISDEIFR